MLDRILISLISLAGAVVCAVRCVVSIKERDDAMAIIFGLLVLVCVFIFLVKGSPW